MALPLAGVAIGGLVAKALGGFLGKKSKQKKESAAAAEQFRSGKATHDSDEQRRLAALRTLLGNAAGRGINLTTDPAALEARPFTGPDPRKVTDTGNTLGMFGDLLGGAGDVAFSVNQAAQLKDLLGAGQPTGGLDLEGAMAEAQRLGIPEDDVMELVREMLQDQGRPRAR